MKEYIYLVLTYELKAVKAFSEESKAKAYCEEWNEGEEGFYHMSYRKIELSNANYKKTRDAYYFHMEEEE